MMIVSWDMLWVVENNAGDTWYCKHKGAIKNVFIRFTSNSLALLICF